jgi:hypothetical protein
MKLANVNWPTESENERIRRTIAGKDMVLGPAPSSPLLYAGIGPKGNLRGTGNIGDGGGLNPPNGRF